jgi:uncharacterized protein with GYD domain
MAETIDGEVAPCAIERSEYCHPPVVASTNTCRYIGLVAGSTHIIQSGELTMATFNTTDMFTGQGLKSIGETTKRAACFKAGTKKLGVKIAGQYWALGAFDGLLVCESPDDATATAAMLHFGSLKSVINSSRQLRRETRQESTV